MIETSDFKEIISRSHNRCIKYNISRQRTFPVRTLDKIELYNHLKQNNDAAGEYIKSVISLLLLLTDQLRPMSTAGKETGKLMDDISGMMGKLGIKV